MAVLPALFIASAVVGAVGSMVQGGAASAAAETNANIADYNSKIAMRNAASAVGQANADARDKLNENKRALGSIRASYGASGLQLGGSPLDVMEDTMHEQNQEVAKIRYKGELQAIGYVDQSQNYKMKAELSRMEADSALTAGNFSAAGNFLKGATSAGTSLMRS